MSGWLRGWWIKCVSRHVFSRSEFLFLIGTWCWNLLRYIAEWSRNSWDLAFLLRHLFNILQFPEIYFQHGFSILYSIFEVFCICDANLLLIRIHRYMLIYSHHLHKWSSQYQGGFVQKPFHGERLFRGNSHWHKRNKTIYSIDNNA